MDSSQRANLCLACMENYERELAELVSKEFEKSSSGSKLEARQALPHWLQLAKPGNTKTPTDQPQSKEQELMMKQSTNELLKRWRDKCSRLHPSPRPLLIGHDRPPALAFPRPSGYNSSTFPSRNALRPKLTLSGCTNQVNNPHHDELQQLSEEQRCVTPPRSPVMTDLVLGHLKPSDATLEKAHSERIKDLTGCTKDGFSVNQSAKIAGIPDLDSFKRLFKGLAEKVGWQPEAASAVATVVMQCKTGNGKPRGLGPKSDAWLLFVGPDKVGKRKMVTALSELVFGTGPITIHLDGTSRTDGQDGEFGMNFRGKTSLDRVAEAVRRNPFSVIALEGFDRAETLVKGSIKGAIERGRLLDSQGREIGLGSAIFILTTDWLPEELKRSHDSSPQCEERILDLVNCGWQLELSGDMTGKRGAERTGVDDRPTKLRKQSSVSGALSLDLNLSARVQDEVGEGSRNSSDLTVEHEQESLRLAINCVPPSSASELMELVDNAIVFKPVDFSPLRKMILESISAKFTTIMGNAQFIRVDEDALDRLVGGLWLAGAGAVGGFEEWAERVFAPSLQQLKCNQKASGGPVIVRLSAMKGGQRQWTGKDWLPPVAITGDHCRWAVDA